MWNVEGCSKTGRISEGYYVFSPAGFKANLSLVEIYLYFSRRLKQHKVTGSIENMVTLRCICLSPLEKI